MKAPLGLTVVSIMLATAAIAAEEPTRKEGGAKTGLERFFYVKATERNGEDEYRVLSQDELNALQAEISAEGRCYARALIATESEWKKNEDMKKKTFPRSAINPKKVQVLQSFNDRAAADKKLQSFQEKEVDKAERDKERNKERGKERNKGGPKKSKDQQAADARREADRAALEDRARSIFEGKLAELIAGTKKTDEAAPEPQ